MSFIQTTISETAVDTFDDGSISEYSQYNGASVTAQTVTSPVYGGSNAVRVTSSRDLSNLNSLDGGIFSLPGDGLGTYPSQGDIFEGYFRIDGGGDLGASPTVWFNLQNQDFTDGYRVMFHAGGVMYLDKFENGSRTNLDSQNYSNGMTVGDWKKYRILQDVNGNITASFTNLSGITISVSANDTTFTSGGFGLGGGDQTSSSQNTFYFDELSIKN